MISIILGCDQYHFLADQYHWSRSAVKTPADELERTQAAIESRMSLASMSPIYSLEQEPHRDSLQWSGPLVR